MGKSYWLHALLCEASPEQGWLLGGDGDGDRQTIGLNGRVGSSDVYLTLPSRSLNPSSQPPKSSDDAGNLPFIKRHFNASRNQQKWKEAHLCSKGLTTAPSSPHPPHRPSRLYQSLHDSTSDAERDTCKSKQS